MIQDTYQTCDEGIDIDGDISMYPGDFAMITQSFSLCGPQLQELSVDEVDTALKGGVYFTMGQLSTMTQALTNTVNVTLSVSQQPEKAVRARNPKEIKKFRVKSKAAIGSKIGEPAIKISSNANVTGKLIAFLVNAKENPNESYKVSLYRMISAPDGNCDEYGFYEHHETLLLSPGKETVVELSGIGLVVDKKKDQQASSDKLVGKLREMHSDPRHRGLFESYSTLQPPIQVDPMREADKSFRMFFAFVPDDINQGKDWEIACCVSNPIETQTGSDGGKSGLSVLKYNPTKILLKLTGQNCWVPDLDVWVRLNRKIKLTEVSAELLVSTTSTDEGHPSIPLECEINGNILEIYLTRLTPSLHPWILAPSESFAAKIQLVYKPSSDAGQGQSKPCVIDVVFYRWFDDGPPPKKQRQEVENAHIHG